MKTIKKIIAALILITATELISPKKTFSQYASVSFQVFYDELSPYGTWIDYPEYGYVWMPVGYAGFSPYYTNGYWSYTDFGWMWISSYPWGWAPFHYGRWMYDVFYGWIWVPDMYWGPAWVVWRIGGGYCGWAPMYPGINLNLSFTYAIPPEHWVFAEENKLGDKNISTYYGPRTDNKNFINSTSVVKNTFDDKTRNTTYVAGPAREEIEKSSGTKIQAIAIKENEKPGQQVSNEGINIYRPVVKPTDENGKKPAPAKVVNVKDRNPMEKKEEMKKTQPEKNEKGKEPEPEKVPPIKKDKLPKQEPPSVPPKQLPPQKPKQEPPLANPPKQIPQPKSPKPERPQIIPPMPKPQPIPKPIFKPHRNMEETQPMKPKEELKPREK